MMGSNSPRKVDDLYSNYNSDFPYGHACSQPQQQQQNHHPYDYSFDQQFPSGPTPQLHTPPGYYPHHNRTSSQIPNRKRFQRTYSRIADEYKSLEEVTTALAYTGLESSNLIVGIDFTKSNEWTGKKSHKKMNLHNLGVEMNPYEQAISIIGRSLSSFDEDDLIPCYGFGDASTHDQDVFNFYPDGRPCNGLEEALSRYREIVPHVKLSGPTSFAPIIEMATTIVEKSGGQYHVLLIIADGQITRSVNTEAGNLSTQERQTVDAIVKASEYPLSIVLVGVGDGPWDTMKEFDDHIPQRAFDNFQFVNFTEIMLKKTNQVRKETEFALEALMEIPLQYRATLELGILGRRTGTSPRRSALTTPCQTYDKASSLDHRSSKWKSSTSYVGRKYSGFDNSVTSGVTTSPTVPLDEINQACPVCLSRTKDMAFGCGHQTCSSCGLTLSNCPFCRSSIELKIKLY